MFRKDDRKTLFTNMELCEIFSMKLQLNITTEETTYIEQNFIDLEHHLRH